MNDQKFNDVIVAGHDGDQVVSAEAMIETGEFSVHGDRGRVTQRLTLSALITVEQAQRVADMVLARFGGDVCDDEILAVLEAA